MIYLSCFWPFFFPCLNECTANIFNYLKKKTRIGVQILVYFVFSLICTRSKVCRQSEIYPFTHSNLLVLKVLQCLLIWQGQDLLSSCYYNWLHQVVSICKDKKDLFKSTQTNMQNNGKIQRKENCRFTQASEVYGAISKQLQIISSPVQTGLCKHNLSGRMPKLSSSHKKKLVVGCSE